MHHDLARYILREFRNDQTKRGFDIFQDAGAVISPPASDTKRCLGSHSILKCCIWMLELLQPHAQL